MKVNSAKIEAGAWVDTIPGMDDLKLRVRGINNADWRRMQGKLVDAVPRAERISGRLSPKAADSVQTTLLLETVLIDWDNVTDDAGQPLPFSKDKAKELLTDPDMAAFKDAVIYAAGTVADIEGSDTEAKAKNSAPLSDGTSASETGERGSST